MQKRETTISVAVLLQMLHYMKTLSLDVGPILEMAGISAEVLNAPDVRISSKKYMAVQRRAVELSKDPWFGLKMGSVAEFGNWAILGYVVMNCATVGEALNKMNLYLKAISDMIITEVQPCGDGIKIHFSMNQEHLHEQDRWPEGEHQLSHCIEASLSSQMRLLRKLTGNSLPSAEVHFPYLKPSGVELHEQIFGPHVAFSQPTYALVLDAQVLETAILSGNPKLLDYFEQYAKERLEEVDGFPPVTQSASNKIISFLPGGVPLITDVAKALSMSVRSLQDQLKQDGFTYSELLNHIRVKQMNQYLRQGLSADEISFMLGFSETSVFRKACKKWTGLTPGQYRKKVQ